MPEDYLLGDPKRDPAFIARKQFRELELRSERNAAAISRVTDEFGFWRSEQHIDPVEDMRRWWLVENDFLLDPSTDSWTRVTGNTGTCANVDSTSTHPGIVEMSTGTANNGHAGVRTGSSSVLIGSSEFRFLSITNVPVLSDGTETFSARWGFIRVSSGIDTDGVFFRYTHSENSGNLVCVSRVSSVDTTSNSSIPVTAGEWIRLEILVNAAGTSASFFVNGVRAVSDLTVLPTTVMAVVAGQITKSAGTTARKIQVDACRAVGKLSTPRW